MPDSPHHKAGSCAAVIAAGGSGTRMGGGTPKQFLELAGVPLLVHCLRAFAAVPEIGPLVVSTNAEYLEHTRELTARHGFDHILVVAGGASRQESVANGLAALAPQVRETTLVAVHDGARPLVEPELIRRCLAAARQHGAAIAAIAVRDTLKRAGGGQHPLIAATVEREGLWQAQTPQVTTFALLHRALEEAAATGFIGTDEAALLERQGFPVALVPASTSNLKVTHPEDLSLAEALLMKNHTLPRIGHGYDVHRLVPERKLILGGVEITHRLGLLGHSDADVLTHALCDAILGALGAGDIGHHFPDHDPSYRGISSLKLLAAVMERAAAAGCRLTNADLTIVAQQPKLAPHLPEMRQKLARICRVEPERINIKATTTEGLGFAGRQEGIAAHAMVLLAVQPASS
ncbi:2-C-methyl-D-erythritol 4-phosphate cytidylyltransferase [Desulfurivibrio sp. D14AmB]|uniref:2-C-methyl-D-erythritol 4-phosphate cytidylyltransferase n=1 Tax=Desulfurivibrio sp. D14AmB TaxID=3374370 RepID=UPI00376EFD82